MIKIMPARTAGSHTGARIRYIIYAGGLESQVAIVSPGELGGLKSPEYMALHPGGKMPLLVLPTGQALPEATVRVRFRCPRRSMPATHPTTAHRGSSDAGIQDYLLETMAPETGLQLETAEERAAAAVAVRIIDLYYGAVMVCVRQSVWHLLSAQLVSRIHSAAAFQWALLLLELCKSVKWGQGCRERCTSRWILMCERATLQRSMTSCRRWSDSAWVRSWSASACPRRMLQHSLTSCSWSTCCRATLAGPMCLLGGPSLLPGGTLSKPSPSWHGCAASAGDWAASLHGSALFVCTCAIILTRM